MLIGICVQVWLVRVRFGLAVRASLIIFDGFHGYTVSRLISFPPILCHIPQCDATKVQFMYRNVFSLKLCYDSSTGIHRLFSLANRVFSNTIHQ